MEKLKKKPKISHQEVTRRNYPYKPLIDVAIGLLCSSGNHNVEALVMPTLITTKKVNSTLNCDNAVVLIGHPVVHVQADPSKGLIRLTEQMIEVILPVS